METLTQVYCKNSERHQTLLSFLQDVMSHCSSVQVARKTPTASNKGESDVKVRKDVIVEVHVCNFHNYKGSV